MMKTAGNKGKKMKCWSCKFKEHYYDDLTNVQLCHSSKSASHTCICDNVFQTQVCPFFERGDRSFYLEMTKYDEDNVKKFLAKLAEEEKKKEIEERALLEYLKKKYE